MLRDAGWTVNVKRVERIWREEDLTVAARQPKRGRLWLNDGSCVRLRPERPDHVCSNDFVEDRTPASPQCIRFELGDLVGADHVGAFKTA
jgi:putative transposase